MKKPISLLGICVAIAACFSLAGAQSKSATPKASAKGTSTAPTIRHLIIISVDSLMPEVYLNPDAHGMKVPNLREIARNGAYSPGARSVFPTLTYPAHTSMLTGVNPGTHGIFTNNVDSPECIPVNYSRWYTEDIRVPTIYQVARKKGLRTGIIYWPVTVGAQADAIVPEFWRGDDGNTEDQKLQRAMATPGLLDAVAKRFPDFYKGFRPPRVEDPPSADVAVHLIETLKPHLLLLHMFEVDHRTHNEGIFSDKAKEAIEIADAQIGRVIEAAKRAGTWPQTALVVVSDHGMTLYSKRVRPGVWMKDAGLVTVDRSNRTVECKAWFANLGGSGFVYLRDENDEQTKQRVLNLFRAKLAEPNPRISRLYTREEVIAMGGDARVFLGVEAADGFDLTSGYSGDAEFGNHNRGHHGGNPENPGLFASLLFYGPSIAPGKIEGARLIDLAPTVAPWLGLKMEQAQGRSLPVPRKPPRAAVR